MALPSATAPAAPLLPQLAGEQFFFIPDWLNIAHQVAVPAWALAPWVRAMPIVQRFGTLPAVVAAVAGLMSRLCALSGVTRAGNGHASALPTPGEAVASSGRS